MNPANPVPSSFRGRGGLWVVAQNVLTLAVVALGVVFQGDWSRMLLISLGAVLFAAGGAVGIAGVAALGRNRTSFPTPERGGVLVRRGIYAAMRHPLYASVMLASLGWALLWQSGPALAAALLLIPLLDAKARHEERWLVSHFPDYPDYQRRVRRFIPGIY
ncbi:MAG: isoprenylcysteine carboxylmethyltransferase family protein [Verrucomicrobia bacterium]|nr:isoprenylcysteine carboxylmethyltransferase family protein [Verrucomicrobiota bacterium]